LVVLFISGCSFAFIFCASLAFQCLQLGQVERKHRCENGRENSLGDRQNESAAEDYGHEDGRCGDETEKRKKREGERRSCVDLCKPRAELEEREQEAST